MLKTLTEAQKVEQSVYRVDSVLGLLLAVVTFESNLIIGQGSITSPLVGATLATLTVALLLSDIIFWVVAVLLQQWSLKFFAWYGTVFLLFNDGVMVILAPLRVCCGFNLDQLGIFIFLFVESNLSVVFCWFVVRQAYVQRLIAANAQRRAKEIEKLAAQMYRALAVVMSLGFFLKLIGSIVPRVQETSIQP